MAHHHVVMFSGGVGSYMAAKRVRARHRTARMTLLFADVLMEDEDLYRFIQEAADDLGLPLTRIAEGRDPWQVFFDERFLGNSRIDPCSKLLKRKMADSWLTENSNPSSTTVYVGIDWSEAHRFDDGKGGGLGPRHLAQGWTYKAPLCDAPYMTTAQVTAYVESRGIKLPRLYTMGFSHNNCGGFCIKAGQGHYANLYRTMPDRYAFHEQKEQDIRRYLGKDVSILTDRRGGVKKPLTLRDFRLRLEAAAVTRDEMDEVGGCGCFAG